MSTGFPFKRILVTTDFSEASRQALPWAAEFARQFRAALTLVHVFPAGLPPELSHIGVVFEQRKLAAEAGQRLAEFRKQELPEPPHVETVLLEGHAAHQITTFARDSGNDLIVTATRGYTGLKHVWLGSTAERIVRHARCPVLVVREQPVPVRFPGNVLCRFHHILVPTDFSDDTRLALGFATAFARPCGGEVSLLHVIEPAPYPEFGYAHLPRKEAALKRSAGDRLQAQCGQLADAGVKAASTIRCGAAFHEIAAQAREHGTDLIIIPAHGRSAIRRALLGSTAERVVRHAPCPVLVVREEEEDCPAT